MPSAYRMHYRVTLGYFCHNLDGFCQGRVIHSKMLHGIQMEAHSNPAVIHDGNQVSDQLLVQPAWFHHLPIVGPIRLQVVRVVGDHLERLGYERPPHCDLYVFVNLLNPSARLSLPN